jgi:hypothetical protein
MVGDDDSGPTETSMIGILSAVSPPLSRKLVTFVDAFVYGLTR